MDVPQPAREGGVNRARCVLYGNREYKLWLSDSNGVDVVKQRPEGERWVGTICGQDVQIARGSTVDLADYRPD